jgi:hypothetical protein
MQNDQMTPEAQAAIERVMKLLKVARDTRGNEHEAQNAMDMAHQILEKHNLDMAVVEKKSHTTNGKRDDKTTAGGLYKWQRSIWTATAYLNMCMYYANKGTEKGGKYENRVIGRPENVLMTRIMAEYLQDTIERIAAEWAKDQGYPSRFVKPAIIFREGMADTIVGRLYDLRWAREQEDRKRRAEAEASRSANGEAPGTSLILADVVQTENDYNTDYLLGLPMGTTAQRRAEREARMYAYQAEVAKAAQEHEARYASDPDYAAEYDAREAEKAEREAKAEAKYQAELERKRRRASNFGASRRINEEDRRRAHSAYSRGRAAGNDVNLDSQIDHNETRTITGKEV